MNLIEKELAAIQNNKHLRKWIKSAINEIYKSMRNIYAINAAVGSGKTTVAELMIKLEILKAMLKGKQSINFFVAPRVKLCNQQANGMEEIKFDHADIKVKVIQVDYLHNDFNKYSDELVSDPNMHFVFVICDKSLWGSDVDKNRFASWVKTMKRWKNQLGFELGVIAYDEAHNYGNNFNKICSNDNWYKSLGETAHKNALDTLFNLSLLLSGTPCEFQCNIPNRIDFSLRDSINNDCVMKPYMNFVNGIGQENLVNSIRSIYYNELKTRAKLNEQVKIIVNCSGIDEIHNIKKHEFINTGIANKDFHVITMHSNKTAYEDGEEITIISSIDGVDKPTNEVYELINKLDNENVFNDDLPILLFQVDMISEGLNLNSFSAAFITTTDGKRFVQQLGRVIRKHKNKSIANIYVMLDTCHTASMLITNFAKTDLLTADCFDWTYWNKPLTGSAASAEIGDIHKINFADIIDLSIDEIETPFINRQNEIINKLNDIIEIEWLKTKIEHVKRTYCWGSDVLEEKYQNIFNQIIDWEDLEITTVNELQNLYADLVNFNSEVL